MVYVVTGATGFLGAEFISSLLENDNMVFAIGRNEEKARNILPFSDNLHFVRSELSVYKDLYKLIPRADVFVNFSWDGISVSGRDMTDIQNLNVQYTIDAMHAAKLMGCRLFVESGSQAEYGIIEEEISESSPCCPFSEYGKAKLTLCQECFKLSSQIGIKYLHLRIFSVFGKGDHEHTLIKTSIKKFEKNAPVELSNCEQNWNFLYVKDAAKQIKLLCEFAVANETFQSDIFNVASNDTRSLKSYIYELKEILGSSSELKFGVIRPSRIVSLNPNIDKLKKAINFVSAYSFADAVREMIKS